jgi:hypothetical protein
MSGYGKSDLMERILELESRNSDLARENAELKKVPYHVDTSPRCPLRDSMTGEMGACDPFCGLLMKMNDTEQYRMCAWALIARKLSEDTWVPVNYWNEVRDD